ncbi:MAG: hypothetical protein LBU95_02365 [Rikenellaceae bacterium]|jgi:hypothetical protein|nr:hypothetical protein [Rikenellaceae bacterium]
MKRKWIFAPLCLAGIAVLAAAVMLLWNWLMPAIFALTAITYWQALGLMVLARLLFGGMRHGGHGHHGHHGHMHEKWMKMTPEQKAEFVRTHGGKCRPFRGCGPEGDMRGHLHGEQAANAPAESGQAQ